MSSIDKNISQPKCVLFSTSSDCAENSSAQLSTVLTDPSESDIHISRVPPYNFLSFSRACNFHFSILQVVHFLFWNIPRCAISMLAFSKNDFSVISWVWFFCHFPGCTISTLAFSRVCIFHSCKFQTSVFCYFPGCDFSVIFQGVQFPF